MSYQYDLDGNRTRVTHPDGNYITYSYDTLDRPLLIQRSGTATVAGYSYNAGFFGGIDKPHHVDPHTESRPDPAEKP